MLEELIS